MTGLPSLRGRAGERLQALLASELATARAWQLKEAFSYLWHHRSIFWAGAFLDWWTERAVSSR